MNVAVVEVKLTDLKEMREVIEVDRAAAKFMRWAAPVSMDNAQWDAWVELDQAVKRMAESLGVDQ